MWPCSIGQIHTSSQAGGIASERMRASADESRISRPVGPKYRKFLPARTRRIPGRSSETYRNPAILAAAMGFVTESPTSILTTRLNLRETYVTNRGDYANTFNGRSGFDYACRHRAGRCAYCNVPDVTKTCRQGRNADGR